MRFVASIASGPLRAMRAASSCAPASASPGSVSRETIAELRGALGADRLAGQGQLHRQVVRDPARQAQQRAGGGHQPALDLGDAEAGVAGGDDEVARQRDLEAAGQRPALDGRDQRLARGPLGDAGEAAVADVRALAGHERLQVHARAERAAGAGEDAGAQRLVLVEPVERGGDPLGDGQVDRVARLRPVDRDDQDLAVGLGADRGHPNSVSAGSRSPRSSARSTSTQSSPRASASTRACGLTTWAASTPRQSAIAGSSRMRSR